MPSHVAFGCSSVVHPLQGTLVPGIKGWRHMQVPVTTLEFLDSLKTLRGFSSDYQLWKYLRWTHTTMSNYRRGRSAMGGAHAIRIADELGLSRPYVLACMEAERENNREVAHVWREIANRFRGAAAIILIVLGALTSGETVRAAPALSHPGTNTRDTRPYIHYAKLLRRLARALQRLHGGFENLRPLTARALRAA